MAITMVTAGVEGAMASESYPVVYHGVWLQIYLSTEVCSNFLQKLNSFLQLSSSNVASENSDSCEVETGWLAGSIEQCLHQPQLPAVLTIPEVGVVINVIATPIASNLASSMH